MHIILLRESDFKHVTSETTSAAAPGKLFNVVVKFLCPPNASA